MGYRYVHIYFDELAVSDALAAGNFRY